MALLERINSMKQQGMSETDIINSLKEEGNSPMDINDALAQSQIKAAVGGSSANAGYEVSTMGMEESATTSIPEERREQMDMPISAAPTPMQMPVTTPMQQIAAAPAYEQYQYPAETAAAYPPETAAYTNEPAYAPAYPQQSYGYAPDTNAGYYSQVLDVETVRDISKQQVEEALRKMREDLLNFSKMKSEIKFEMQDMENRLVKIESMMSEIQSSIIRKIGEYGESISSISKEVRATQQSFSKVLNPLMDKNRNVSKSRVSEAQEESEEPKTEAPSKSKLIKKSDKKAPRSTNSSEPNSASFEDYFR